MLILAFDSTAVTASCAVADIDKNSDSYISVNRFSLFSVKNKLTHSENLMPMAVEVIAKFGCTIKDIDRIAVTVGPGSFTGVRIGVSTVKGLAMPENIPCVAVSTLEALAANITTPIDAVICPLMDARRNQFYNALFDGNGKRLCEDRVITAEALTEEFSKTEKSVILCGDGAVLYKSLSGSLNNNTVIASPATMYQNALSVAVCGYSGKAISAEAIQPLYLRPSQAEREANEAKTSKGSDLK